MHPLFHPSIWNFEVWKFKFYCVKTCFSLIFAPSMSICWLLCKVKIYTALTTLQLRIFLYTIKFSLVHYRVFLCFFTHVQMVFFCSPNLIEAAQSSLPRYGKSFRIISIRWVISHFWVKVLFASFLLTDEIFRNCMKSKEGLWLPSSLAKGKRFKFALLNSNSYSNLSSKIKTKFLAYIS